MSERVHAEAQAAPKSSFAHVRAGLLQRKSLLSMVSGLTGEFADSRRERLVSQPPLVQAKLTINQPNDRYEQEADRVADEVMRMPEPEVQRQVEPEDEEEEMFQAKPLDEEITPLVQRQVEPEEGDEEELQAKSTSGHISKVNPNLESHIHSLKGGGQPLSESDRTFFEPRFGRDFSQVRMHMGAHAAEAARAVNARAFTMGKDVVFGAGEYAPDTSSGKELIAHELTHVVQNDSIIAGIHIFSKDGESKTTEVDRRKKIAWTKFETELKEDFKDILYKSSINLRMAFITLIRELMSLVQEEEQVELSANALESSILTVIPHVGSILSAMLTEFLNRLSSGKLESIEQWIDSIEDDDPMDYLEKEFVEIEKTQFLGDPRFKAFFEKAYADCHWSKEVTDPLSVVDDFANFENYIETNEELDEINNSYITPEKDWKQKLNESIGSSIRENIYLTRVETERPWLTKKFTLPSKLTPEIIKEKLDQALSVQKAEISRDRWGGGLRELTTGPKCKYLEGAVKAVYNHIVAQVSPSVWRLEEDLKAGYPYIDPEKLPWDALENYSEFDGACCRIFRSLEGSIVSLDTLDRISDDHMEAVEKLMPIKDLIRTWYERSLEEQRRAYEECLQDLASGQPWRVRCSSYLTPILLGEWRSKAIDCWVVTEQQLQQDSEWRYEYEDS